VKISSVASISATGSRFTLGLPCGEGVKRLRIPDGFCGRLAYRLRVSNPDLSIVDRPEARRFEARLGDELAGWLDYRRLGGRLVLLHTEVPLAFAGQGIAGGLARHVLEEALAAGTRVTVKCPFVAAFVRRHPEYAAIVTPDPVGRPVA
jgi:hypothetical protein